MRPIDADALKKEGRKERGVATRDTAERKTASRENERSGNNAKIEADALKETICSHLYPVVDYFNSKDYGMFWTGGIEKAIDEQPTIDAVPVIRCKDCIHNVSNRITDPLCINDYSGDDIVCDYFETDGMEPDDYCSYAERKEE